MKKFLFAAALAVLMAAAPMAMPADMASDMPFAVVAEAEEPKYSYEINEDGETATITGYNGSATEITIPSVVEDEENNEYTVTKIGDSVFSSSSITEVTFETDSKLETIGDSAFSSCESLTKVTIPDSVTTIGGWAFDSCTSLGTVTFGDTSKLETIGNYAFYATGLTSIEIPSGVTSIGDYAFCSCESLTKVTIPDSVTTIAYGAFESTAFIDNPVYDGDGVWYLGKVLAKVDKDKISDTYAIQSGTTQIMEYAFFDCAALTEIEIPDSVTEIGDNAFNSCVSLTSIEIPNSVTTIGDYAFYDTGLTSITIPDSVTSVGCDIMSGTPYATDGYDENGFLYAGKYLIDYNGEGNEIEIKEGTTVIANDVFNNFTAITSVTIPDSVTSIGDNAFYYCESLEEVTIPDSVTTIGESAFYGTGLTSIEIPDSVTTIGESAFNGCTKLETVTVPAGVTDGYNRIFYDAPVIKLTVTGSGAIAEGEFIFWSTLTNVMIEAGVTTIGESAFSYCASLESVTIPDSVTIIGDYAFYCCESLKEVTIPDSVTSIGDCAFNGCTKLETVTVPAGVTDGYNRIFNNAPVTELTVTGNGAITESEFSGWDTLETVIIEAGVTEISGWAFDSCTSLETVTFGDASKLETIGNYAFYATGLTSIEIPDSVTSIGYCAFDSCTSLTKVTVPASVTSIGAYAFPSDGENKCTVTCYADSSAASADGIGGDEVVYVPNVVASNLQSAATTETTVTAAEIDGNNVKTENVSVAIAEGNTIVTIAVKMNNTADIQQYTLTLKNGDDVIETATSTYKTAIDNIGLIQVVLDGTKSVDNAVIEIFDEESNTPVYTANVEKAD